MMALEEDRVKKVGVAFDGEAASSLVKELRTAFGGGKTKSYEWRLSQLKALLKMTDGHEKDIVAALRSDLSKPEFESFLQEIALLKSSCELALKKLKHWMAPEKVKTSMSTFPSSAEIISEPLGVTLIISAWNYPFLLSLDPVIGAIAAGNAVVLKPSEVAPATSSLLAKLIGEYMDSSAVRVVEGAVPETSALLEQKWDKIFYTDLSVVQFPFPSVRFYLRGSSSCLFLFFLSSPHLCGHKEGKKYAHRFAPHEVCANQGNGKVGRIVLAAAAKHLTPVVLELGGKSPVVVDANINLEVATRRIIAGKWGCNSGQACVSPDYIITTKDYAPTLIDSLKFELEKFYGKDPLKSDDLSRIVNSNHFTRLTELLDDDKVSDKIVHGGERDKTNLKITPTILLDVPEDSLIMNEEIFGPLLPILTVDKVEDCFDLINSRMNPLAAYLFTNDKQFKEEFVKNVSAGGLVINDTTMHLAVDTLPFGGVGESGMGAYHGKFSFDAFSHKKAVLHRSFGVDPPARYPPYTPGKLRLLKALLSGSIFGIICALLGWSKG